MPPFGALFAQRADGRQGFWFGQPTTPSPYGLMAAQVLAGLRDPYDVDLRRPSEEQIARVNQLVDQWMSESAGDVFFIAWQEKWRQPRRKTPRAVVESLVTHTQPQLAAYINMLPYELKTYLPRLDTGAEAIRKLMAAPLWPGFKHEDAKVAALAKWFKHSFMKWVDPIKCPVCGGDTQSISTEESSSEERRGGSARTEMHKCVKADCGAIRRFPRYNRVPDLLRSREGRCGEFAHLFLAFLRVADIQARYVWNSEDHVWTEYWSPSLLHWVHVDSCEAAVNKPLLYARGWGKKQAFCIAAGPTGIEDVTRAYVDDWPDCQRRRRALGWSEYSLKLAMLTTTIRLRANMSQLERVEAKSMDRLHAGWMNDERGRLAEMDETELGGRESGPADWRAARQELGLPKLQRPRCRDVRVLPGLDNGPDLLGDAKLNGHGVTLTTGPGQTSAAFLPRAVKQTASFKCELTFRITAPPGCGEADGMAIVFASERKLGLGGYGLGYSGNGGPGDFAIEIDTYRTQDHADDPPTPHISLHSPPEAHHSHSIACTAPNAIPHLGDGKVRTLHIYFDAPTRRCTAFLTIPGEAGATEELSLFEATVPQGTGGDWHIGLTGSCGGLWQMQEIISWSMHEVAFE